MVTNIKYTITNISPLYSIHHSRNIKEKNNAHLNSNFGINHFIDNVEDFFRVSDILSALIFHVNKNIYKIDKHREAKVKFSMF